MPKSVVSENRIRGGGFLTSRYRFKPSTYGFNGPQDMVSKDLGFRTFRRMSELPWRNQ